MNFKILVLSLALSFIHCISFSQSENEKSLIAMKHAIGSIIDKYTVYSYPTNNFGVGTSCRNKWVPQGVMVCDMVSNFGLDTVKENEMQWKNVNGYAYYGKN